jgi:hypothetical protein
MCWPESPRVGNVKNNGPSLIDYRWRGLGSGARTGAEAIAAAYAAHWFPEIEP